jgi:hypothetical protein
MGPMCPSGGGVAASNACEHFPSTFTDFHFSDLAGSFSPILCDGKTALCHWHAICRPDQSTAQPDALCLR